MSVFAEKIRFIFIGMKSKNWQKVNETVDSALKLTFRLGGVGNGGMDAVYLAARRDGKFSQRVAVKMLRREFNTEEIRRNFN